MMSMARKRVFTIDIILRFMASYRPRKASKRHHGYKTAPLPRPSPFSPQKPPFSPSSSAFPLVIVFVLSWGDTGAGLRSSGASFGLCLSLTAYSRLRSFLFAFGFLAWCLLRSAAVAPRSPPAAASLAGWLLSFGDADKGNALVWHCPVIIIRITKAVKGYASCIHNP